MAEYLRITYRPDIFSDIMAQEKNRRSSFFQYLILQRHVRLTAVVLMNILRFRISFSKHRFYFIQS